MNRVLLVVWICGAMGTANAVRAEEPPVDFNRDIRPIMSDTCFKCHGPAQQEANLRLDSADQAMQPADSGAIPLVPGKPEDSEVIRRIFAADDSERMPPPEVNKVLTEEQKELFRRWVQQGATYENHWSFQPLTPVAIPTLSNARVENPIDAFIIERLQREHLAPSPEADKSTLIRRVAFVLTGLPPTLEDVERYLADDAPLAYERMVDRYLASPRFGEEMARHWLDVARYADTHGLHLDNERQMWAYRDWVIRAFNTNLPFDQFTMAQLAGDLLPAPTQDQLVATGFIRCNVTTGEGGSIEEEWIYRNAVERASTTTEAWMGLTGGCAVCHDHKFDPISAKEFYSLYAFFHSAADPALDGNALLTQPSLKLMSQSDQQKLADFDAQIATLQERLNSIAAEIPYTDPATTSPAPEPTLVEQVWIDDQFPATGKTTASPGHPTTFVTAADGQVLSGERALKRTDPGLAQDVHEGSDPLDIPANAQLFAHVWIDGQNPPKTLMLQYFKGGWLHRAVWGDYDAIDWGAKGTSERVHVGALPPSDQWVRLEVPAELVALNTGDQITGFALTQFGGTVYWDKVGVAGRIDPATDPRRSFAAWWKQQTGKDTPDVPAELNQAIKDGPEKAASAEVQQRIRQYYLQRICSDTQVHFEPVIKELDALRKQRGEFEQTIPSTFIFRDLPQPRESFVMDRGQYNQPGEKVEPNTPAFLPPLAKSNPDGRATRLDLARWLLSDEHPLTARVAVNRLWQQVFGTGLVKTSFDFGSQGETPSHPELLDWLALHFREGGWDQKAMLRLMVCSATFRQSSRVDPELVQRDPENRLYARGPRVRLDAEQIRDNALAVSGLIQLQMGGRGVKPYQPPNIWEPVGFVGSNTRDYQQDKGVALYRRSVYTFMKRTAPPPFMSNFDAPNRESICMRRERSNTPLQALQTLNDVQHFEAARALAERVVGAAPAIAPERIRMMYRIVLARTPDADELAIAERVLNKYLAKYQQNPELAQQVIRNGESVPTDKLAATELAAYTLIANLIMNLDETLMRN